MLSILDLKMSFGDGDSRVEVLDIKRLDIDKGRQVAITGASGCGKTTLFNIISGLIVPIAGSVTVNGVDITTLSEVERDYHRAENIGYIFQDFNLFPELTAIQNVMLPLSFLKKYSKKQMAKMSEEMLVKVNMGHRMNQKVKNLSGGEKQRIAIARSLVNNPKIILADEPTGNLDYRNGAMIIELLKAVASDINSTLLVITHDINHLNLYQQVLNIEDINEVSKGVRRNDTAICQN